MQLIACSSTIRLDRLNTLNHSCFSQGLLPKYHILMRSATCSLLCPLSGISAHSPFGTSHYDSTSEDNGLSRLCLLRVMHSIYITSSSAYRQIVTMTTCLHGQLSTLTLKLNICPRSQPDSCNLYLPLLNQTTTLTSRLLPILQTPLYLGLLA